MKLVEAKPSTVGSRSCWKDIITEFYESSIECAEVTDFSQKLASAYNALRHAIVAAKLPVKVYMRDKHLYLKRTDR